LRMMPVLRLLAKMKGLRGTALDVFGYSADRRLERNLIVGYERDVALVLDRLSPANAESAIELLSLPVRIRGYGPIKEKAMADAKVRHAELVRDLEDRPSALRQIAAE
jgi:indolepyruvate ferredoxin oxidoreductase